MFKHTSGVHLTELKKQLGFFHWLSPLVNQLVRVEEFDSFLNQLQSSGRTDFFGTAKEFSQISSSWSDACLARIPREGPLIIMANHPHGLADGIVSMDFILRVRPDALVVGNRWLAKIPGIQPWLIEVNPYDANQADWANVSGTRRIINHLKSGGCVLTFPSGEVSNFKIKSLSIEDSPWSSQLVKLARKLNASILPINIEGKNSSLFYSIGMLGSFFQTSMLLREFHVQRGKVIRLRTGKAIHPVHLTDHPDDEEATRFIRLKCELLSKKNDKVNAKERVNYSELHATPVIRPVSVKLLKAELESLPSEDLLLSSGDFKVYRFLGSELPHVMREIGRLREVTFRSVSEGTGKDCDIDAFDAWYDQIVLWDDKNSMLVGGYRLGPTDRILPLKGKHGMYSSTLFDFKGDFFKRLDPALEMGRSFIREEYQRRPTSLPLLWRGIGRYVVRFPQYNQLFGPVSINPEYGQASKELILAYLKYNRTADDLVNLVRAKNPPRSMSLRDADIEVLQRCAFDLEHVSSLVSDLEADAKSVPVLLKHYLKLNGRLISFNVDQSFGGCLDGLILVDLTKTDPKLLSAYMSEEGAHHFLSYHDFENVLQA